MRDYLDYKLGRIVPIQATSLFTYYRRQERKNTCFFLSCLDPTKERSGRGRLGNETESRGRQVNLLDILEHATVKNPYTVHILQVSLGSSSKNMECTWSLSQYLVSKGLENMLCVMSLHAAAAKYVTIVTSSNPKERGCQLSLQFSWPVQAAHEFLSRRGVVVSVLCEGGWGGW